MKALFVLVLFLSGCTTIGHAPPPAAWPVLKQTITHKSLWETHTACGWGITSFVLGAWVPACARIQFNAACTWGTCDIITSSDSLIEHEKQHCEGRDHVGSTYLADFLQTCLDNRKK